MGNGQAAGLKVGVVLPTRETIVRGGHDPSPLVDLAEQAEESGFDSVWVGDSIFGSARFEPLTILSAVGARTKRVEVGTAILIAGLRSPVLLAHAVATLDQLTHGRVILGLGAGWLQQDFDAVGVPFGERLGRFSETIRICRSLWSGGPVDFAGKYWRLDAAELKPAPYRSHGPPIWVGGMGPRALRVAARLGDGWFPTGPSPEGIKPGWEQVLERARVSDHPNKTLAVYLTINLDADRGDEEIRTYIESYYGLPYGVMQGVQAYYAGAPAGCFEWLQRFIAIGAGHLVLRFASPDPGTQLEVAARELLPQLRST
jgi:probable F420-dependent oxidoreductase